MSSLDGAPPSPAEAPGGGRRFRAASPPKEATSWATTAVLVALLLIAATWQTLHGVRGALAELKVGSAFTDALLVVIGIGVCVLLLPALRSLKSARDGRAALAKGDLIAARVAAAASRELAWYTCGFAGALALLLIVVQFLIANDLAVSRTFFLLP